MLDGLQVARISGQIRLICPEHPTAPLRNGHLRVGAGPGLFSKHCSIEGCHNLAYSATQETLDQEVQELGQQIHEQRIADFTCNAVLFSSRQGTVFRLSWSAFSPLLAASVHSSFLRRRKGECVCP